jgi:hypothetical protein
VSPADLADTDVAVAEPELARRPGRAARDHALARYGLDRFLSDWDALLGDAVLGDAAGGRADRTPVATATTGRS